MVSHRTLKELGRDAYLGEHIAERYGITRRLGVGGMGVVYSAWDELRGEEVAIKFLLEQYSQHPSLRARFIREVEALASIESPYVVKLLDFGFESDRRLWYVMEHVEGWTLRDEVNRNGAFNLEESQALARQLLKGLAAAHDAGLIHRDLKHDNIMFTGNRAAFIARILDFGVVKSEAAELDCAQGSRPLTANGVLVGSPSYMSPEQIQGLEIGPPADLYGLAVVLVEVLMARRLFIANDYEALLQENAQRELPSIRFSALGEQIPKAYAQLLLRALAPDPAHRFPDARTMLLAMEQMEIHGDPSELLADPSQPGEELKSSPSPSSPPQAQLEIISEPSPPPRTPSPSPPLAWAAPAAFLGGILSSFLLASWLLKLLG